MITGNFLQHAQNLEVPHPVPSLRKPTHLLRRAAPEPLSMS